MRLLSRSTIKFKPEIRRGRRQDSLDGFFNRRFKIDKWKKIIIIWSCEITILHSRKPEKNSDDLKNSVIRINYGYMSESVFKIRNVLTRRREYGTYLATARRHRRRLKMQKRDE